jgi:hypothetical protein
MNIQMNELHDIDIYDTWSMITLKELAFINESIRHLGV